jgi:drug/metabolite transporter (DMT)-like permease
MYVLIKRKSIRPNRLDYITLRSFLNIAALICFFSSIQLTTVTKATLLNMTYPVFVFVIAPFINKEKAKAYNCLFLLLTLVGTYLVTDPDFANINRGDLFALLSAIIAGFSLTTLREARKHDESYLIMFYLTSIGIVINFVLMGPFFVLPESKVIPYLFLASLFGFLGQVCSTIGFRYLEAAIGALMTASRILFASVLGISIFADPLTLRIILGGILILISLVGVSGIIALPPKFSMGYKFDRPEDR